MARKVGSLVGLAATVLMLPGCATTPEQAYQMGQMMGCALGGGCSAQPVYYPPVQTYQQPQQQVPRQTYQPPASEPIWHAPRPSRAPAPAPPKQVVVDRGCTLDIHCRVGNVCVRQGYGKGECVVPVDQHGMQTYTPNPSLVACRWSTDCPAGFQCKIKPGHMDGYCMK